MALVGGSVFVFSMSAGVPETNAVQESPPAAPGATATVERNSIQQQAEEHLKFLYTSYFTIRGCTEASVELGKQELQTRVSLDEARSTMQAVEQAAKEVGLDIDAAWRAASPVGQITAESLKKDTPENLERCRSASHYFRLILSRFQLAIAQLGSKRSLIKKDF